MRARLPVLPALLGISLGCSVLVATQKASAQTAPQALNRFEPSERGSEWFVSESLDLRGKARPALGVVADWAYKPYTLVSRTTGEERSSVIANSLYVHPGASIVLWERLRLGLSVPIALAQGGDSVTSEGRTFVAPKGGGFGDPRLAADVRILGRHGGAFTLAGGLRLWIPIGASTQYVGDGEVRFGPRVAAAGEISSLVYAATLGVTYRDERAFATHTVGTEMNFSAAVGGRFIDKKLVVGPELWGSTVISDGNAVFRGRNTPTALVIGGHYTAGAFRLGLGAGPGLSHAAGTAVFRTLLSAEWVPPYEEPKAPPPAPPPAPRDGDNDGILDRDDACPEQPGVKTDDPKTNGCPPPADRDNDGVSDANDACPDVPGVKTGNPATNGCPADRDNDSVPDSVDACPDTPGVKSDDPKTNGCPSDRDRDLVLDIDDACPDAPGPKDSDPKKNGCPAVRIEAGQVKILEQIKFKTASAEILKESQPIIDAVAMALKEHAEIKHLRVEGHTDNKGAAAMNKDLSKRRAASVVAALVKAGVAKTRLTSQGFGSEKPIDSNTTDEGRAANRRVEFHIEETP
jgi:outer membrane protein OmpA-like peptidoglycan-associated protein